MRLNTNDLTLQRNFLEKYRFLITEYEQVKNKTHPLYKKAKDFYSAHSTCAKSFLKYYNRFKQSGEQLDLLPQKRGPRYKTRRPLAFIENKVIELRQKGNNRYEIYNILKPKLNNYTPSASGIYNIFKRNKLNRLTPPMQQEKRKIIKQRAGELGHVDCHHLSPSVIRGQHRKLFLVCVVDSCTRIAWAELVEDVKSLTVMFAVLKSLNILAEHYNIRFEEIITDNGPEFGVRTSSKKEEHPFERLLIEMNIKHRYCRPYRPQTNGKAERLWRTLEEDLLQGTHFDSIEELKEELLQYMYYYNHERPHQGINGNTPVNFRNLLPN